MSSLPLLALLLLLLASLLNATEEKEKRSFYSPKYVCEWVGTAPFCMGECDFPWKEFRSASNEQVAGTGNVDEKGEDIAFGWTCWTGDKTLCCKEHFHEVNVDELQ